MCGKMCKKYPNLYISSGLLCVCIAEGNLTVSAALQEMIFGRAENRRRKVYEKTASSEKKYFFHAVKNFPQVIENTREIIENMSEIIQNISDIFFAVYTPVDFQLLGR